MRSGRWLHGRASMHLRCVLGYDLRMSRTCPLHVPYVSRCPLRVPSSYVPRMSLVCPPMVPPPFPRYVPSCFTCPESAGTYEAPPSAHASAAARPFEHAAPTECDCMGTRPVMIPSPTEVPTQLHPRAMGIRLPTRCTRKSQSPATRYGLSDGQEAKRGEGSILEKGPKPVRVRTHMHEHAVKTSSTMYHPNPKQEVIPPSPRVISAIPARQGGPSIAPVPSGGTVRRVENQADLADLVSLLC